MPISKYRNILISIFGLVLVDQITKAIFANRDFFVGFMHFHLVKNFGLSFGANLGGWNVWVIILAAILFFAYSKNKKLNLGTILVAAGAVANIIDRVRFGYVRDFWDIGLNFTFNLADAFIFIGGY
jgi:signal peptidase II